MNLEANAKSNDVRQGKLQNNDIQNLRSRQIA